VWDVVRRYLRWRGYDVQYVQNFTDIDDKILKRAQSEGVSMEEISERFINAYFEDMERLGVEKADAYPRATHTLDGMQRLVSELESKGYAYPAGGDVYYSVRKFPEYGKLSGRKLEDLKAGASGRVEEADPDADKKRDPFDFALWKAAKPGETSYPSPWGEGRPGWHIECSAMVKEELGETIDIHVGGGDLMFPHHENEIAQSEAATGKPLARYWLHNGMVKVGGDKMAKSLGNFITIRDLLEKRDPMVVRLFILQTHYRKPVDFTEEGLDGATNGWNTLKEGLLFKQNYGKQLGWEENPPKQSDEQIKQRFADVVDDDFNFAGGLAIIFELAKELRKEGNLLLHEGRAEASSEELAVKWHTLAELADVFGLKPEMKLEGDGKADASLSDEQVESLIEQRVAARKEKNFAEADRIRDELQAQGIKLIDQPGGNTRWYRE
jgi:cysteinyl-tRNA synthetase